MVTAGWVCLGIYLDNPFRQPQWVGPLLNFTVIGLLLAGQLVLPPALLLLLGFFADKRFHLTDYLIARYGSRWVIAVVYFFLAAEVLLIRHALFNNAPISWSTLIHFIGSILPGLLLLLWWGVRKYTIKATPVPMPPKAF